MTDETRSWPEQTNLPASAYYFGEAGVTKFEGDEDDVVIMCEENKESWVSGVPEDVPP